MPPRFIWCHFPVDKLIAEVRKNQFLYDPSHPEYKNFHKKADTWREIAKKFNNEPKVVKMKWRNCRDSYLKYKRSLKGSRSENANRYKEWPWTKQMRFLDPIVGMRPPRSNDAAPGGNSDSRRDRRSASAVPSSSGSESSDTERPSQDDHEDNILSSPTSTQKAKKNGACNQCVVSYFENKQKTEDKYDEVDHLFQSYAKTFKRFNLRSQAKLKIQLAQLFAETELAELDDQRPVQSSSSHSATDSTLTNFTETSPVIDIKCNNMTEL